MKSDKKYLVVLAGSPRGGDKTWNSLFKYVINHLDADLAISTTDNYISRNLLFEKANYKWIMPNPITFESYFEEHYRGSWKEYLLKGKELGLYHSGMISFAFKDFILRNYQEVLLNYEYIIYSRFDQLYVDYHPDFNSDKIYIPSGEDYFGICDRHAVFRSKRASEFLSIVKFIDSKKSLNKLPKFPNCESVFKSHLEEVGLLSHVERFDRISFTASLKDDPTKWRTPSLKIFFTNGVMIKYPDEYLEAMKNKFDKNVLFKIIFLDPFLNVFYFYISIRKFLGKILKKKTKSICDLHGEYFMSSRYSKLESCPECSN